MSDDTTLEGGGVLEFSVREGWISVHSMVAKMGGL